MAAPVTEIVCVPLKPDIASAQGFDAVEKTAKTALTQPGAQRAYYGAGIEDPTKIWLFIDWDSIEHHKNFQNSEVYGPMVEEIQPLIDASKFFIKHVEPKPFPPASALDSTQGGATEVLTMYFPPDITTDATVAVNNTLEEFVEKALTTCSDIKGVSSGWSVETDVPVIGQDGKSGTLLVAFVGWPSVEAHMKFRETQPFKDNIGLLRQIPDQLSLGLFHVSCKSLSA